MQVLLRPSDTHRDAVCSICGQAFRIYWERTSDAERESMHTIVAAELRDHHSPRNGNDQTAAAHPGVPFNVPGWSGSPRFSGAAILGGLSGLHRRALPTDNEN